MTAYEIQQKHYAKFTNYTKLAEPHEYRWVINAMEEYAQQCLEYKRSVNRKQKEMELVSEVLRDGFEKIHVEGLGFSAAFHKISIADAPGLAHNHPCDIISVILENSYIEKIYTPLGDKWGVKVFIRKPGDTVVIKADRIHAIIALPEGPCTTFVKHGTKVQDFKHFEIPSHQEIEQTWD